MGPLTGGPKRSRVTPNMSVIFHTYIMSTSLLWTCKEADKYLRRYERVKMKCAGWAGEALRSLSGGRTNHVPRDQHAHQAAAHTQDFLLPGDQRPVSRSHQVLHCFLYTEEIRVGSTVFSGASWGTLYVVISRLYMSLICLLHMVGPYSIQVLIMQ